MKTSEFELIHQIKKNLIMVPADLIRGIGDDCAVLKKDEDSVFLISTDCLVEKVHFELKQFSFIELGKKAMSVNLSDIAAMGGVPLYAFVTIGVSPDVNEGEVLDLYTGMQQVAAEFQAGIVGGDTTSSPKSFFVSLTVVGVAKNGQYKLRSDAKVGDGIYVSGNVGSSAVGLKLLQKKKVQENNFIKAHKNPRPRIQLGQLLGEASAVHAMIDLSDGLLQDLGHVLSASQVSAEINFENLPLEDDFFETCRSVGLSPEDTALTGGEDYQLLFTMDDAAAEELSSSLVAKRFKITRIGTVLPKEAVPKVALPLPARIRVLKNGKELKLGQLGYDHFLAHIRS